VIARHARLCLYAAPLALATALAAPLAGAQDFLDPLPGRHHDFHSPQNFALEFRFSPYQPDVDSDPALNGATPFKDVFGDKPRFFAGAEIDWQALRIPHFGTLGPGLSAGYTSMTDPAPYVVPQNGQTQSGENTTLQILPINLLAVVRADVFWRDVGIPLVPYVKLGLGYAFWRASNTL
jgi:hypothetical protein